LRTPSEYSIDTQTRIIISCTALHNWVRSIEGEQADSTLEKQAKIALTDIQPAVIYPESATTSKRMDTFRDQLAEKMWIQYQGYINREQEE
jgi:hypothetical protein